MDNNKHKAVLLLFTMLTLTSGCASIADRQFACRDSLEKLGYAGYVNLAFANVFQVGDCASIKPLRIETGQYYSLNRRDLQWAIETEKARSNGGSQELHDFAKALRCEKSAYGAFSEMVLSNKAKIFGENFERWSRPATKEIIKLIGSDPELKNQCAI